MPSSDPLWRQPFVSWRDQAEIETLQRKRLDRMEMPPEYPEPTWSLRVGQYRVLYSVEGDMVRVLRVILKGRRTLGETL